MSKNTQSGVERGVAGNALLEQQLFEELVTRVGQGWLNLGSELLKLMREGTVVHRVTIKGPWSGHDELLVVLVADGPDGPVVAFHSLTDQRMLPFSLAKRLAQGQLKWKADQYAK